MVNLQHEKVVVDALGPRNMPSHHHHHRGSITGTVRLLHVRLVFNLLSRVKHQTLKPSNPLYLCISARHLLLVRLITRPVKVQIVKYGHGLGSLWSCAVSCVGGINVPGPCPNQTDHGLTGWLHRC